jgi:hypothetical protein
MNLKRLSRLGAAMTACALAACSAGNNGPTITSDHASITLVGLNGAAMSGPTVKLTLTLPGSVGKTTYYGLALADSNQFSADFIPGSNETATLTLTSVGQMAAGTTASGKVTFEICSDEYCAHVLATHEIPYTATMFLVDTTPLSIQSASGADTKVQVAVAPSDTNGLLGFTSSNPDFLQVDHADPARLQVTGSGRNVADGSYSASIDIGYRVDGTLLSGQGTIPVALTVGTGSGAAAAADASPAAAAPAETAAATAGSSAPSGQATAWPVGGEQAQ